MDTARDAKGGRCWGQDATLFLLQTSYEAPGTRIPFYGAPGASGCGFKIRERMGLPLASFPLGGGVWGGSTDGSCCALALSIYRQGAPAAAGQQRNAAQHSTASRSRARRWRVAAAAGGEVSGASDWPGVFVDGCVGE